MPPQRDIERELLPMAEAFGMTMAAWSPLAGGILSGKAAGFDIGFPLAFINEASGWVFGAAQPGGA